MSQELLKLLKELKQIQPNLDYSKRSKSLILASKAEVKSKFKFSDFLGELYPARLLTAVVIAGVLFLIIYGGFYYANKLNQENLFVKASEINSSIQIKLNEIKYRLENQPTLNPTTFLLVQSLLEKATNELKEASELSLKEETLEEAFQKIKSAQDTFNQIESLLTQ